MRLICVSRKGSRVLSATSRRGSSWRHRTLRSWDNELLRLRTSYGVARENYYFFHPAS